MDSLAMKERHSNPNIDKEVKKRLSPDAAEAANRSGRWRNQIEGCTQWLLQAGCSNASPLFSSLEDPCSEELLEALTTTEMPLSMSWQTWSSGYRRRYRGMP
ncbi:Helicase and polymerase-containing protein TEBICHI [Raphanus sativus]|nr:Helicase and polymerase-containing protein TEBICHI [Raphanus sativus]